MKKSFYRRVLPQPPATAFSSAAGKLLFRQALEGEFMEGFFSLIEQFRTQDEPSFCGLSTLAMVLNALQIDPSRIWKGSWRWFSEQMLDCCLPLATVVENGITFDKFVCLARCNGAQVRSFSPDPEKDELSLTAFRNHVKQACSSTDSHLVVSYSRKVFGQSGDGHYSPVGGYHEEKDQILVLDVARFKYPPHWVPLTEMYKAMQCLDEVSNSPRGWMLMSKSTDRRAVYFVLLHSKQEWPKYMEAISTKILKHVKPCSKEHCYFPQVFSSEFAPNFVHAITSNVSELGLNYVPGDCKETVENLLSQIRGTDLFKQVDASFTVYLENGGGNEQVCEFMREVALAREYVTMLIFAIPSRIWRENCAKSFCDACQIPLFLRAEQFQHDFPLLHNEILALRTQLDQMLSLCSVDESGSCLVCKN